MIANEGISVGHSTLRKDFRVYNKRTKIIKESIYVTFDEYNPKTIKVKVIDYAGIFERTNLKEKKIKRQIKK